MNRWRVFNILSVIAGMLAAAIWISILLALLQASFGMQLFIGYLLGRVTTRLIGDQIR
jgi:hypothetical protein